MVHSYVELSRLIDEIKMDVTITYIEGKYKEDFEEKVLRAVSFIHAKAIEKNTQYISLFKNRNTSAIISFIEGLICYSVEVEKIIKEFITQKIKENEKPS